MSITNLLNQNGFIMTNKKIIKMCGLHEAILLGALCSRQDYWNDARHWDSEKYALYDGFFFCTAADLEEETTLSPYLQRNAFKNLIEQGFIETQLRGVPALKWFRVNEKKLQAVFLDLEDSQAKPVKNSNSSNENFSQQEVKEFDGNNIKSNNIKSNENILKSENNMFSEEINEVISYLNTVTGKKYKGKSTGHRKIISARLREGFTVSDFKTIIDKKYLDWHNTEYEKYLTPSTLFCTKHFEDYLNQEVRTKPRTKSNQIPDPQIKKWDGTADILDPRIF